MSLKAIADTMVWPRVKGVNANSGWTKAIILDGVGITKSTYT